MLRELTGALSFCMALVLFFDGECGFCNKSVRKINRLDRDGVVDFAPLQGKLSREMGLEKFADKNLGTMVVLRESDGERFFKGDAGIQLGKALGQPWAAFASCFAFFPKSLRDSIYDLVARHRYLIFGKTDACEMPGESLKRRMRE